MTNYEMPIRRLTLKVETYDSTRPTIYQTTFTYPVRLEMSHDVVAGDVFLSGLHQVVLLSLPRVIDLSQT